MGCVLASALCAMVGTYIVTRRLVFISGGITHASMGGVGIGMYTGFPPLVSAAAFAVLSACGVQWMSRRGDVREDSAIALFWTLGMSVGIICSFLTPGYTADLSSYLFGNLLTITTADLLAMAVLTLVTAVVFVRWLPVIRSVAFDAEFARSCGLPVEAIEYAMMALIALTIVACLRMVGVVLVISLLTVPQATANLFCRRFGPMVWGSMLFGVADSLGGLLLATWLGIPSGAAIIFVSISVYALCRLAQCSMRHTARANYALCLLAIMTCSSCSTKKNTRMTRFYHGFTAHYNTYYNGEQAYLEGVLAQEKGHKDNYSELLPMIIVSNKSTAGMGKGYFETAVTKSEKAIKKHSIKAKPIKKGNGRMSDKEKAFRKRLEYNPFIYRAWMLLAQSQFRSGDFIEAASTFGYINRLYGDQPDIASQSRAWLARCYVMLDWPYDAEDVIRKMERDSVGRQGRKQLNVTKAAYYIQTGQTEQAIPHLQSSIKHQKHKNQRARLHYLLAQLYQQKGDNHKAYKEWGTVCRMSPPYELEFNARIMQTEVMSGTRHKQMISRLRRMARSDKNKDYLDRVYHAIGNIYLNQGDTMNCIWSWEAGVEKATQSGPAKAMLLLRLGQLYYGREQFIEAQKCYAECVSLLDKDHREYSETEWRNKVLSELEPHLSAVKLQDSLQALAKLPEAEYMAAIDRVIDALKKKEKEEAKKKAQAELDAESASGAAGGNTAGGKQAGAQQTATAQGGQKGAWYFYSPQAVAQGKTTFKRQWGNRALEDNWRWTNKPSMGGGDDEGEGNNDNLTPEEQAVQDSIAQTQQADEDARVADSLANDPHNREFYLKQIPFEPEQLEASHAILSEGLYNAALIEQEKMENYMLAMRTWARLLRDYPDYAQRDNAFYHLFLANGRLGNEEGAAANRDSLINTCPESQYTRLLLNPRYEQNARRGKHIEDSLYATAYQAYLDEEYKQVEDLYQISTEDFPKGPHRARMLFVRAMSWLYGGERDSFLVTMKELTSQYSKEEVAALAQELVKGVQEGRLLSGRSDAAGLWGRHAYGAALDSINGLPDSLVADSLAPHLLIMAWPAHDLDEKQLLFEVARYNFTGFMVRSFDIETITEGDIHQLRLKGFNTFAEVHAYVQQLFSDAHMATLLDGIRIVQISEANLLLLGTRYSYDEYDEWFRDSMLPEGREPAGALPDEPEKPDFIDPDDYVPEEKEDEAAPLQDDFDWPF